MRDYDAKTGKFTIRQGKGGKFREVYLAQEAKPWLKEWLSLRSHSSSKCPQLGTLTPVRLATIGNQLIEGKSIIQRRMKRKAMGGSHHGG